MNKLINNIITHNRKTYYNLDVLASSNMPGHKTTYALWLKCESELIACVDEYELAVVLLRYFTFGGANRLAKFIKSMK